MNLKKENLFYLLLPEWPRSRVWASKADLASTQLPLKS